MAINASKVYFSGNDTHLPQLSKNANMNLKIYLSAIKFGKKWHNKNAFQQDAYHPQQ